MGKDKQLYLFLEARKDLKRLLDEAVRRAAFYEKCVKDYSVRLYDLDETIREMRGEK